MKDNLFKNNVAEYKFIIDKLQDLGQVGIWKYDFEKQSVHWSRDILRIFGLSEEDQFSFGDFLGAVHADDLDDVTKLWPSGLPAEAFDINHRIVASGQLKWIRHRVDLDYSQNGNLVSVIGFVQDISEFKFLEEKAIRAAQLAAVGEFTTMIAHEVNNPLSGVINYAQVFKNKACNHCENVDLMDRIMGEGNRIAAVVKNLIDFSYNTKGKKGPHRIDAILINTLGLMAPKFKKNGITVEMDTGHDLPNVCCNIQQIEQVVLNILRNANKALTQGSLTGESEKNIRIQAKSLNIASHSYVELLIANNGPNISPDLIDKIKTPFYSVKTECVGTGLGLSMSSEILKNHDGFFEIESIPGEYTKMILRLPVA